MAGKEGGRPAGRGTAALAVDARSQVGWAHRLQDVLIRGVEGGVRLLPEAVATVLGGGLGWMAGSVFRIRRRVVEANLRRAFPQRDGAWIRRIAAASYRHLGREGVALLRMGALGPREVWDRTEVEGIEHLREPVSRGRGVVLLTGHLGNWEVGGAAMAVREIPMDVVAKRQNNPLFDARINRTRERLGMRVFDRSGSTKHLLRSLREGRVVALVADQNVLRGGVFVDFFGVPASTTRGPALLAERTGAAVVFASSVRLPGLRARYRVRLHPLEVGEGGDADAAAHLLLRRYMAALEAHVAEVPEQYLWAHKRWKTRPPEEGPGTGSQGTAAPRHGTTEEKSHHEGRAPRGGPSRPPDPSPGPSSHHPAGPSASPSREIP